jgi:hypothetical protein
MKTTHKLLQALVACSLASVALNAGAEAADDWVAYRQSHSLPVYPTPSRPGELPTFEGPVPDAPKVPLDVARELAVAKANGNVNTDGGGDGPDLRNCDPFFVEVARTDGDPEGETGRCN